MSCTESQVHSAPLCFLLSWLPSCCSESKALKYPSEQSLTLLTWTESQVHQHPSVFCCLDYHLVVQSQRHWSTPLNSPSLSWLEQSHKCISTPLFSAVLTTILLFRVKGTEVPLWTVPHSLDLNRVTSAQCTPLWSLAWLDGWCSLVSWCIDVFSLAFDPNVFFH